MALVTNISVFSALVYIDTFVALDLEARIADTLVGSGQIHTARIKRTLMPRRLQTALVPIITAVCLFRIFKIFVEIFKT